MASLWCPGASIQKASSDAGVMLGGPKKVVWHSTENDPNKTSASNVAAYLRKTGSNVHIVWNPVSGEIVQCIPANRGGKGLKNLSGGVETNRAGTYVIQIEVVGKAVQPFTGGPCKNLNVLLTWIRDLGIPAVFPSGTPKAYPDSYGDNGQRSTANWAKSGHFCHSQVPENSHGDPGAVSTAKLTTYPGVKPPAPVDNRVSNIRVALRLAKSSKWDASVDSRGALLRAKNVSTKAAREKLQAAVGAKVDGDWGPNSEASYDTVVKNTQRALGGLTVDGDWGNATTTRWNTLHHKYCIVH